MRFVINYVEIGNRIRTERESFDMNRLKLSELLDLSPYFIGQIERGERKMSINTLIKVCECLHISLDYLIFNKVNVSNNVYSSGNSSSKENTNSSGNTNSCEISNDQTDNNECNTISDTLYSLLSRCSKKEIDVIEALIKVILPHISR